MPLTLPEKLPAIEELMHENIFVMDSKRASTQDIRPLKILILNLMPIKETTETDFVRLISNTPLQVEITFLMIKNHVSKNTPIAHLDAFYKTFDQISNFTWDGMIITGAPLELIDFDKVGYWNELQKIFNWTRTHVTSTMYICWASMAGLYHFYGIPKYPLAQKMFGVFRHAIDDKQNPIFRGFDDEFFVPHSRHSEIHKEDILKHQELKIIAESDEAGVYMVMARGGREIFITGHSEYSPMTLDSEYRRDLALGKHIEIPCNYYRNNDPSQEPVVRWRGHANLLFSNWLNYFVYQETPYDIRDIK